jgi:acyl-coenzyme A synthetase/AMP-(fatty) acid ligase/acyl carrier protein
VSELNTIFKEIDQCSMAEVIEYPTLLTKSPNDLKNALKLRISQFKNEYDFDQGQCIILKKSNDINFLIDMLALFYLGVTAAPIDPETPSKEVENIIIASRASALIDKNSIQKMAQISTPEFRGIALLLFTSGTTGEPKGVMISRLSLERKWQILDHKIPSEQRENTLCFVPTFFGHGLICNCLFPFFYGKKLVLAPKMNLELAQNLSEIIKKFQINFFSSVPSHWNLILQFSPPITANSPLKRVHCASAPLRPELASSILQWLGDAEFFDVYGATEMLGWFAARKIKLQEPILGFDDFWEVEKKTSPNSELLLKSDYMFTGYWINQQKTVVDYFNSGDIFEQSNIMGRTKNVINKNGIKISAEEVVQHIFKSGNVLDAAVVALSDPMSGERVGAAVVLKENSQLNSLKNYIASSFSENMRPSELIVVDKIPVSARGKVSIPDLIKLFQNTDPHSEDVLGVFNKIFKTKFTSLDISKSSVSSWDSMRHAELIIALQKKFGIKFEAKEIVQVENLNELAAIINLKSPKHS